MKKVSHNAPKVKAIHKDDATPQPPLVHNLNLRTIFETHSERNKYPMQKCKLCFMNGRLCERYVPLAHVAAAVVLA